MRIQHCIDDLEQMEKDIDQLYNQEIEGTNNHDLCETLNGLSSKAADIRKRLGKIVHKQPEHRYTYESIFRDAYGRDPDAQDLDNLDDIQERYWAGRHAHDAGLGSGDDDPVYQIGWLAREWDIDAPEYRTQAEFRVRANQQNEDEDDGESMLRQQEDFADHVHSGQSSATFFDRQNESL